MNKEAGQKKTVAGKYVIYLSQILGKGTFATTYLCKLKHDPSQLLACKLMNKQEIQKVVDDLEYLIMRVKDEVGAWQELIHPNIVHFIAYEETKNNIYFFLQYCPDGSLESYIIKHRFTANINQMVRFAKQLVSAGAYLQSKNIVHRDIKPANILLKGNQLKLGDFGLARAIKTDDQKHINSFFTFAGTIHYMAPQIIKNEKHPYKCDVWSVGVTIYVMFSGELPFGLQGKDNSEKIVLQKIFTNKQNYTQLIFKSNPQIVRILQKMLNPNPIERPRMNQIAQQINKLQC